jgi:hypothetical protein
VPRSLPLSIRTKLFAAFGVLVALTAALGIAAVLSLLSVSSAAVAVGTDGVAAETSLSQIGQSMNKLRKDQIHYMVVRPSSRADVHGDITGDLADLAGFLRAYGGTTPAERAADQLWDPIKAALVSLQNVTTKSVATQLWHARSTYSSAQILIWTLLGIAAALGLLLAVLIRAAPEGARRARAGGVGNLRSVVADLQTAAGAMTGSS